MSLAQMGNKKALGCKHTEESRKKHSLAQMGNKKFLGKKHTKETKKKMSSWHIGKKVSEETKKRISLSKIGKKLSEEHKRKISLAGIGNKHTLGYKHTKETKKKMSSSHIGRIPWIKGKKHTKEAKEKISLAHKGKILSNETKEKMSGQNNHNWNNGSSFEPYTKEFNAIFKAKIRERDKYSCQLCNMFEPDHLKLYNCRLSIHHIDYDKSNTLPQNCITLCHKCNNLVNKDRELWIKHFQAILNKLCNYKYTTDQKIILEFT